MNEGDKARAAAAILWMANNRARLVHAWPLSNYWNAMAEWPVHPRKKWPTEKHVTGAGDTRQQAIERAIEKLDLGGIRFKLFLLEYLVSYLIDMIKKDLRNGKASEQQES